MYDLDLIYSWTLRTYKNFIRGAQLARINAHEDSIHAAWVAGIVSKPKKGREKKPDDYFNAKKARDNVLNTTPKLKQQLDFTLFDQMRADLATFDWGANLQVKEE